MQKIPFTFEAISPACTQLSTVISSSIGSPTPEKIAEVLHSYQKPNQSLIGAFSSENLIGVVGFEKKDMHVTIKHISVVNEFRNNGIAKSLIRCLIQDCKPITLAAQTDEESVNFYKKLGFRCEPFTAQYGMRYQCSSSDVSTLLL